MSQSTPNTDAKKLAMGVGLVLIAALAFVVVRIADRAIVRQEQAAAERAKEAEQASIEQAKEAIKRVFALHNDNSETGRDYYKSKYPWMARFFFGRYRPELEKEGERRMVNNMSSIPLDGCPSGFAEAYRNHILAYRKNLAALKYEPAIDPDMQTWDTLVETARKYGVDYDRKLTMRRK